MKCAAYQRRSGGWNKGRRRDAVHSAMARARRAEFMVWQAEFIGWPALAESFRRDLDAANLQVEQAKAAA